MFVINIVRLLNRVYVCTRVVFLFPIALMELPGRQHNSIHRHASPKLDQSSVIIIYKLFNVKTLLWTFFYGFFEEFSTSLYSFPNRWSKFLASAPACNQSEFLLLHDKRVLMQLRNDTVSREMRRECGGRWEIFSF